MQKLTCITRRGTNSIRGSALITAVVLALIMAIGGIGFLLVTTGSTDNDSDAYTRDKAFYAAESGALLAAKYLMSRSYANWPTSKPHTFLSNRVINDHYVTVRFYINTALKQDTIKSEAFSSSTVKNAKTFKKRMIVVIQNDE